MNDLSEAIGATTTMPKTRGRKPKGQQLIRPAAKSASPKTHVNDPTLVPTYTLKLQMEQLLYGFDNDISLLDAEINSKLRRKADLEVSRDACLAGLGIIEKAANRDGTYLEHQATNATPEPAQGQD